MIKYYNILLNQLYFFYSVYINRLCLWLKVNLITQEIYLSLNTLIKNSKILIPRDNTYSFVKRSIHVEIQLFVLSDYRDRSLLFVSIVCVTILDDSKEIWSQIFFNGLCNEFKSISGRRERIICSGTVEKL